MYTGVPVSNDCESKVIAYSVLNLHLGLIRLVSMTPFISKATPTNDTDYSCHTKAVELV